MIDLQTWENSVLGQHLLVDGVKADAGQCSQVPLSWAMALNPGVKWSDLLPSVGSDKGVNEWAGKSTKYFSWIENNHNDINQLPLPGDIMVFGATGAKASKEAAGGPYSNTFENPYGHAGVCKSASASGYTLIQQNSPNEGQGVNDTSYPWKFRPCLGWFRPSNQYQHVDPAPAPAQAPVMSGVVGKTLHLPAKNLDGSPDSSWCVYNENGPYDVPHAVARLNPAQFGGLDYQILRDLGNGIYVIQTQMFGRRAIWTRGTNATIS